MKTIPQRKLLLIRDVRQIVRRIREHLIMRDELILRGLLNVIPRFELPIARVRKSFFYRCAQPSGTGAMQVFLQPASHTLCRTQDNKIQKKRLPNLTC